jgi:hypothetical protein
MLLWTEHVAWVGQTGETHKILVEKPLGRLRRWKDKIKNFTSNRGHALDSVCGRMTTFVSTATQLISNSGHQILNTSAISAFRVINNSIMHIT